MARDPYRYFRIEGRELLEQLGQGVLDLEKGTPASGRVAALLRLAHTLKGAARVVKQPEIADQAHAIEDALAPFRETTDRIPRERIDAILEGLDDIRTRIDGLAPAAGDRPETAGTTPPEPTFRTVRTDVGEMDALLDRLTEAQARVGTARRTLDAMEPAQHLLDLAGAQLAAPRHRGAAFPAGTARGEKTRSMVQDLRRTFGTLGRDLRTATDELERELRQVRDIAERLRLVPAGALFPGLERVARDAARAQGKRVAFDGRGGDVRLDAHVLEAIQSALVQLIRNAVAHGIESDADRMAAGKAAEGRIVLSITRRGRRAVFECRDDGRGVDVDAVRQAMGRKGLLSAEVQRLGLEALIQRLLQGGITTSGTVSEVSGRGIGLDVVWEAVNRLGGEVTARTEAGRGTTFELSVPLSLASLEALLVESAGILCAIPLDAVRRAFLVPSEVVTRTGQHETLLSDGEVLPFFPLRRALPLPPTAPKTRGPQTAVVVATAKGAAAVGVDRLQGTATVVLRPLPDLAPAAELVAGAFVDPEGTPRLVVDPDGLVAEARRTDAVEPALGAPRPLVLVVDDSLTTRMLEQSILESAGYRVETASSGEDALEKARRTSFALFLVDVEMPGMDGFTFIESARMDPGLRDIPSILVTSRGSANDRQRGRDVGARAYIVKSEFDQGELLERIRTLIG